MVPPHLLESRALKEGQGNTKAQNYNVLIMSKFMAYTQDYGQASLKFDKIPKECIAPSQIFKLSFHFHTSDSRPQKEKRLESTDMNFSLIEDPLWRRVCKEIVHLMGPIAGQIFHVQLGIPHDKNLDLYCETKEALEFVQTYNFIVLSALQGYFPSLQRLNVNNVMKNSTRSSSF